MNYLIIMKNIIMFLFSMKCLKENIKPIVDLSDFWIEQVNIKFYSILIYLII